MAEFQAEIGIEAAPDAVYQFIVNPMNLPRWQPAFREAFREAADRIRVVGGGVGMAGRVAHPRFAADPDANSLSWGSAQDTCSGEAVAEAAAQGTTLRLTLRLNDAASGPEAVAGWTGDPELGLEEALHASLVAAKAWVEDRRTVVEPASGGMPGQAAENSGLRSSQGFGHSATLNSDVDAADGDPDGDIGSVAEDGDAMDAEVVALDTAGEASETELLALDEAAEADLEEPDEDVEAFEDALGDLDDLDEEKPEPLRGA